jgi:hypothetical protein
MPEHPEASGYDPDVSALINPGAFRKGTSTTSPSNTAVLLVTVNVPVLLPPMTGNERKREETRGNEREREGTRGNEREREKTRGDERRREKTRGKIRHMCSEQEGQGAAKTCTAEICQVCSNFFYLDHSFGPTSCLALSHQNGTMGCLLPWQGQRGMRKLQVETLGPDGRGRKREECECYPFLCQGGRDRII